MKKSLIISYLYLVFCNIFYSCNPTTKISEINVNQESDSLKTWNKSHLFVNEISRTPEKISLLNQDDSASIEIRAFQHSYFKGDTAIPKTWVIGYVNANTKKGKEELPGPIIETTYGNRNRIRFINKLQETILDPTSGYPKMTYKRKDNSITSFTWYPIIYNVKKRNYIEAIADMLYPKPTLINNIPTCKNIFSAKNIPEMSSYFGTTVHLHGSNVAWRYDGYTNSSYLKDTLYNQRLDIEPNNNIGGGLFGPYEKHKSVVNEYYNSFPEKDDENHLVQHGAILWYHDHAMMHTSLNVYAGLLAPYIIQAPKEKTIFKNVYINEETERHGFDWFKHLFTDLFLEKENNDIPLVINDKSFTKKGFLYYESTSSNNAVVDTVQPEFFGNTITVNGKIWPKMKVEAKTYRFRLLNTCSSRTLAFGLSKYVNNNPVPLPKNIQDSTFVQIGTEGGLKNRFVSITDAQKLVLAPGERADVIINFSQFAQGESLVMMNYAPNSPFTDDSSIISSITTIDSTNLTNVIMAFQLENNAENAEHLQKNLSEVESNADFKKIVPNFEIIYTSNDMYKVDANNVNEFGKPYRLNLKEYRNLSLLSKPKTNFSELLLKDPTKYPITYPIVLMNDEDWNSETMVSDSLPIKKHRVKEVKDGDFEIWEIVNNTPDTHPLHIHLNRFKILGRRNNDSNDSLTISPYEIGWKDVVRIPAGQTTYIKVQYLLNHKQDTDNKEAQQFVYHCHILEHEDVSMMRRLVVKPKSL